MTILIDQGLNVNVVYNMADSSLGMTALHNKEVYVESDTTAVDGMEAGAYDASMTGAVVKDPLLSNSFFVIGVTVATLLVGGVLGLLLAKKKIKKGIELYED